MDAIKCIASPKCSVGGSGKGMKATVLGSEPLLPAESLFLMADTCNPAYPLLPLWAFLYFCFQDGWG